MYIHREQLKRTLRMLALPLLFLLITISLYLVWQLFDLPTGDELARIARDYFDTYGPITIFISAIIEGMLLFGLYYPGSAVIFLGVIFAGRNPGQVALIVTLIMLGLSIAYIINFLLGKYGWYRVLLLFGMKDAIVHAEQRLEHYGLIGIFSSYWQPNLAAITSTAAGILHFPFRKFLAYSTVAVFVWSSLWAIVAYIVGEAALSLFTIPVILAGIGIWIIFVLIMQKRKTR